jgi:hypothetical protein
MTKAPTPRRGRLGRIGRWGRRGRVDRGPILLKKSILILLFLISWARRQIELISELKKVKKKKEKKKGTVKKSSGCGHGFLLKFDVKNDLRHLNWLK